VVPGHPNHGPFYLVQGLLNALPRFEWDKVSGLRTSVYISMLPLLAAFEQRSLPYSIDRVESNDVLFALSKDYVEALRELRSTVIQEILSQLGALKECASSDKAAQARVSELAVELMGQLVRTMALNEQVAAFLLKLIDLASKSKALLPAAGKAHYDRVISAVHSAAKLGGPGDLKAYEALAAATSS